MTDIIAIFLIMFFLFHVCVVFSCICIPMTLAMHSMGQQQKECPFNFPTLLTALEVIAWHSAA